MRRVLLVAGVTALIIAAGIVSLAFALAIAWDEVPPPPEATTSRTAPAPAPRGDTHDQASPSGGPNGPLLVAATLEGRLT